MDENTTNKNVPDIGFTESELDFIQKNKNEDVTRLVLKSSGFKGLDVKKLAAQILSRQKASKKLPEWSSVEKLIFPPALSVEQCSSEATAKYKSTLIHGKTLIDITGGMGVDSYYLSRNFDEAHYYEQQEEVAETARYNFALLNAKNILVHHDDSIAALAKTNAQADWIYADPARRDANKQKVVLLSDCAPDVKFHLPELFKHAPNVLLKTSPLLDIDLAVQELKAVKEIHVMGYEQECKELLFSLNKDSFDDELQIKARVVDSEGNILHQLDFTRAQERDAVMEFSEPLSYLYEPHPAVLKAGGFRCICPAFHVKKLAVHSHLYTSKDPVPNFPGRCFEIIAVCKPDAREIDNYVKDNKANLTIRNFPAKIDDLRKKWRLKDGGNFYLFATTLSNQKKIVVVTKKL
ncbi:THUMP-like domain-containing protein [Dyadobacter sp. LHD-138]|uniref:THUMP-like domain-containing protein n=1 Tax=Dyadobacter sp. LHD-138 TaxID=3071413 RepID=UPI0027E164AB|nr:RsmD family RNA methyltransferase [Dyadobacter sp. LHD-138]MDQ6482186.1 RsmD family RNA methyltransferase [Dyadobacter sp. LHD-138]